MARIRTIKPEFWADEAIAKLSYPARLLSIALLNFADDEGRLRGSPMLIRAECFPYEPDIDIVKLLAELQAVRFVVAYEDQGQKYLWIRKFVDHQKIDRPKASQLPQPPPLARFVDDESTIDRRRIAAVLEGKGREGNGNGPAAQQLAAPALLPLVVVPDKPKTDSEQLVDHGIHVIESETGVKYSLRDEDRKHAKSMVGRFGLVDARAVFGLAAERFRRDAFWRGKGLSFRLVANSANELRTAAGNGKAHGSSPPPVWKHEGYESEAAWLEYREKFADDNGLTGDAKERFMSMKASS